MSEPILSLRGVTKRFGTTVAVDDVTLDVPRGVCFAWLGPNGCGKTTLIRLMLGLARPTAGEITVRGHRVPGDTREALRRVGAIVEEPRFYPYMTGRQNLRLWAAHYGPEAMARIDSELDRVGLTSAAGKRVSAYSLGMRQRLGVARALLGDPELLLLDEPTNGLDPAGFVEFRTLIRGLVAEGRTVFLSSHILDEVERMADEVAIIQQGRMIARNSMTALKQEAGAVLLVRVDGIDAATRSLEGLPGLASITPEQAEPGLLALAVAQADDATRRAVAERIVGSGAGLLELTAREQSLEHRFLEITGNQTADRAGTEGTR